MKRATVILILTVLLLVPIAVSAGAADPEPTEIEAEQPMGGYSQSPMLDALVASGELPPVEDRLPDNPMVMFPIEEIGKYGGTMEIQGIGDELGADLLHVSSPETLIGRDLDSSLMESLAESWEYSDDNLTMTLNLRSGTKWSNGDPFGAEDLMFSYEHIALNEELTPTFPGWLQVGGENVVLSAVDESTVQFEFASPAPWFGRLRLVQYGQAGQGTFFFPSDYMKQFHPAFTDADELAEMATEEGFENWVQLFRQKSNYFHSFPRNPDLPTLGSYNLESAGVDIFRGVRNPYYWKVDPSGQQLPYIDRMNVSMASNNEVYVGKVASGEVDYASWVVGNENFPLYSQTLEQNNQTISFWDHVLQNRVMYHFNLTVEDLGLREIVQDVRFRRAMSLALDRDEIVDVVHLGFGDPRQGAGVASMTFYDPDHVTAYAEYDPAQANALLDEMGLTERDADGYRLRPDGKRLSIILSFWDVDPIFNTTNDLSVKKWQDIGVEVIQRGVQTAEFGSGYAENTYEMSLIWHFIGDQSFYGSAPPMLGAPNGGWGDFAPLWADWLQSDGDEGIEPPEVIQRNFELQEQIPVATSQDEVARLMGEILQSQAENIWYIGTAANRTYAVYRANLVNVPPGDSGFVIDNDAEYRPETWWYR